MADRTNKRPRGNIEVGPAVKDQFVEYLDEMERLTQRRPKHGELIKALILGTPVWQAVAMLDTYRPRLESDSQEAE